MIILNYISIGFLIVFAVEVGLNPNKYQGEMYDEKVCLSLL
jgi:hypothetical protein